MLDFLDVIYYPPFFFVAFVPLWLKRAFTRYQSNWQLINSFYLPVP